jgi:hypothetical protein
MFQMSRAVRRILAGDTGSKRGANEGGNMKKRALLLGLLATLIVAGVAAAANKFASVKPKVFDPAKTYLVGAKWQTGLGCPTNSKVTLDGITTAQFTDDACPTSDVKDTKNTGLLLAKTGPLENFAAATATLNKPPNPITVLGYDLRKPGGDPTDPRGSHCSGGAPRFDLITDTGAGYTVACLNPAPTVLLSSEAWQRLRWGPPVMATPALGGPPVDVSTLTIKTIEIIFDEGTTVGPDNFGLAVLDNIDINGTLIGK